MRRRCFNSKPVEVIKKILSSTTWYVPLGCTYIDAFAVGGGGAGASNGGGGGGGAKPTPYGTGNAGAGGSGIIILHYYNQ